MGLEVLTSIDLMQYMVPVWDDAKDLYALERTNSVVKGILYQLKAWEKLHKKAFLPDVENDNYSYKSFRVLQQTMKGFTADVIARHIGKPIGRACVRNAEIEELLQFNPKDPSKRKVETYKGIYLPQFIERPQIEGFATFLWPDGRLYITSDFLDDEKEFHTKDSIRVPLSSANAAELFETPLYKKPDEESTVFITEKISQQINRYTNSNGGCVRFIDATLFEDTLNKPWKEQVDLVNKIPNTDCAELIDIIFLCGLQRLESGAFSLTQDPGKQCYARVPDATLSCLDIQRGGIRYKAPYKAHMMIGANGGQLHITNDLFWGNVYAPDGIGLIPRLHLSKIQSS